MAQYVLKKKCNNCGAEIPRSAAYCDICGARCSVMLEVETTEEKQHKARKKSQRRHRRRTIARRVFATIGIGIAILFTILVIIGVFSMHQYEREERLRDLSGWDTVVTKEDYEKIDVGMSYDEIAEIVGGPGKRIENDKYRVSYAWPGEYYVDGYHGLFIVSFYKYDYDEKKKYIPAGAIEEMDILRGEESYETYKLYNELRFSDMDTSFVTKEQVEKITEGMNYEQICEILGEGKLLKTRTWITDYDSNTYEDYIWRCKRDSLDDEFYFQLSFRDGILRYYSDWQVEHIE